MKTGMISVGALAASLLCSGNAAALATVPIPAPDIAIGKARTSARLPFPTRMVAELAYGKDGNPAPLPGIAEVDGVIAFAGGLPIMVGDAHVGGIGVSGGTADQDEVCASTALDAVAADLK